MNLEKLEKSKGVVFLAKNTDKIDYVQIAKISSEFVEKNLKLSTTIVEPSQERSTTKKVITATQWKNFFRWEAWNQSPYDTTILLDSDYIVLTDSILKFTEGDFDYRLLKIMLTPSGLMESYMGQYSKRHLWATIVVFNKTKKTEMLFEVVKRVESNWKYYSKLFRLDPYSFRNDFAFTIADLILNGYTLCDSHHLPCSALTIENPIKHMGIIGNFINVKTDKENLVIVKQDLHLLDKEYILSDSFLTFKENYFAEIR
jgi:alpha-N-acetylglucosamine transferase